MTEDNAADVERRVIAAIEAAFEQSVTEAAGAEWAKLSGRVTTPAEADRGFIELLRLIVGIRERQLRDVAALFEAARNGVSGAEVGAEAPGAI